MDDKVLTVEERLERLEARDKLLSARLRQVQQQRQDRKQWQSLILLSILAAVVVLASGVSVKGKSGDSEFAFGIDLEMLSKSMAGLSAAAIGFDLFSKKKKGAPEEEDDSEADR